MCVFLISVVLGKHLYWGLNGYMFHGETLLVSWVIFLLIMTETILSTYVIDKIFLNEVEWFSFLHYIATVSMAILNLIEDVYVELLKFAIDLKKSKQVPLYNLTIRPFIPYFLTVFIYITVGNLAAAIPKFMNLESGELVSPVVDLNISIALGLIGSLSYFYMGFKTLGLRFFLRYIEGPAEKKFGQFIGFFVLFEEISKPTALSLRLFGIALSDEVLLAVLLLLTNGLIPLPALVLGSLSAFLTGRGHAYLIAFYIHEGTHLLIIKKKKKNGLFPLHITRLVDRI